MFDNIEAPSKRMKRREKKKKKDEEENIIINEYECFLFFSILFFLLFSYISISLSLRLFVPLYISHHVPLIRRTIFHFYDSLVNIFLSLFNISFSHRLFCPIHRQMLKINGELIPLNFGICLQQFPRV